MLEDKTSLLSEDLELRNQVDLSELRRSLEELKKTLANWALIEDHDKNTDELLSWLTRTIENSLWKVEEKMALYNNPDFLELINEIAQTIQSWNTWAEKATFAETQFLVALARIWRDTAAWEVSDLAVWASSFYDKLGLWWIYTSILNRTKIA